MPQIQAGARSAGARGEFGKKEGLGAGPPGNPALLGDSLRLLQIVFGRGGQGPGAHLQSFLQYTSTTT